MSEVYKILPGDTYPNEERAVKRFFTKLFCYKIIRNSGVCLAGGAIRSIFMNEEPSDYDLFFRNRFAKANFDNNIQIIINRKRGKLITKTNNAATYAVFNMTPPVQTINMVFGDAQTILKTFDIVVCKAAYCPFISSWVFHESFLKDLEEKKITLADNIRKPYRVMRRCFKYQQKGFKISDEEILRLSLELNSVEHYSNAAVTEQIFGEYQPYFNING